VNAEQWWGWLRRGFIPATTIVLILAGAVVPLPAFVEQPGSATGIPACVTIDGDPVSVNGDFMFTTVAQRDATVFGLMLAAVRDDQDVVPRRDILGGVRRDEYFEQQREVFLSATERATIVALEAAGYTVVYRGTGVAVLEVIDGTPAEHVLREGDVITGINGAPVLTDEALIAAINGTQTLHVAFERDGETHSGNLQPEIREVDGRPRPVIGVRITTRDPEVELPVSVDVVSGHVGGPSAGLMLSLAIFDMVDDVDLAAGRRIAGTGTLAADGTVGPIDNIDLKVPAAVEQGAQVFVTPAAQTDEARAAVPEGADLAVVGVDTFDDARTVLRRTATGDAPPAPPAPRRCPFSPAA
jgi:PDZ domain-containing protein